MRGIQIRRYAESYSELAVTKISDPEPRDDQYLIEVHATAANFFDLLQISGKYQTQPRFPWIAGCEFAGVVISIPKYVLDDEKPKFQIGDKVFGASQGAFATKIAVEEDSLKRIPKDWSFADAAGLFVTAATSFSALVLRAGLKKGDFVLIHAGAGGLGLAAIQIARAYGATVIATASTDHKLQVAKSFGADYAINYTIPTWPAEVRALTPEKRGVDVVFDPVCMMEMSTKCAFMDARLVVVGFAGGSIEKLPLNKLLLRNVNVLGHFWGSYVKNKPQLVKFVWDRIYELIETGQFKSTIYTENEFVGLENVPHALKLLESRRAWGKVVVKVPQEIESRL
ncbi:Quinone oxidoreductase-like protein 2-like protein [Golovinomyces cichoracearum]|uniref:Quinone oxidoreductase-like protein 2-like protein n=1 Tax=Golovinomyces cichoracearum TaxID=62708 RepID=A0A420JAF9_9PEZI|nr:Quinone oxidoreductase-like protein 2-like protein [Golovinomyces cichoracearum]